MTYKNYATMSDEDLSDACDDGDDDAMAEMYQRDHVRWKAERAKLEQWVADLQSGMFINCVYCGHRYGPKESHADAAPRAGETMAAALKRHVESCPKHPMAALRAALKRIRDLPTTNVTMPHIPMKRIARKALAGFKDGDRE